MEKWPAGKQADARGREGRCSAIKAAGDRQGRVWLECDVEQWEESLHKWIGFVDGLRPPAALNLGNGEF